MATAADFTTRARDEMYSTYVAYQSLAKRIDDLTDEVNANGGAVGLYGVDMSLFPLQADGFDVSDMAAAFVAITTLVGEPTVDQKNAIIKARR
ncbi:MAG: hypothetical protein PHV11_09565 [Candidatus Bipolaricaulis sp.]|nr:hypothetical protein [Candidatus Bipolaricaulis sp.]